ncbi:MAG: hypothetical protein LBH82_06950, partial [Bacteroidales bacterium]|nr:hypothetical protein [Bacteroidales bacterium]
MTNSKECRKRESVQAASAVLQVHRFGQQEPKPNAPQFALKINHSKSRQRFLAERFFSTFSKTLHAE